VAKFTNDFTIPIVPTVDDSELLVAPKCKPRLSELTDDQVLDAIETINAAMSEMISEENGTQEEVSLQSDQSITVIAADSDPQFIQGEVRNFTEVNTTEVKEFTEDVTGRRENGDRKFTDEFTEKSDADVREAEIEFPEQHEVRVKDFAEDVAEQRVSEVTAPLSQTVRGPLPEEAQNFVQDLVDKFMRKGKYISGEPRMATEQDDDLVSIDVRDDPVLMQAIAEAKRDFAPGGGLRVRRPTGVFIWQPFGGVRAETMETGSEDGDTREKIDLRDESSDMQTVTHDEPRSVHSDVNDVPTEDVTESVLSCVELSASEKSRGPVSLRLLPQSPLNKLLARYRVFNFLLSFLPVLKQVSSPLFLPLQNLSNGQLLCLRQKGAQSLSLGMISPL
jgi:hypothetical protein